MAIQFFGEIDRQGKKKTGEVRSEYPCWYHPARIDELQESIAKDQRMLDTGAIDKLPNTMEFINELERKKALLGQIEHDKPILTGKDKDRAANAYVTLGDQIKNLMPSYSDMEKGLADPHEEVLKDSNPCVSVEGFVDIARECGIKVPKHQNQISRKQATRVWKILGKALGERSNVEFLRRDQNTGTWKPTRDLNQIIKESGG